jgi:exopolyphosphatase / guanosine-5'-triphosphate,3'-diphosphate pyrophosphatase
MLVGVIDVGTNSVRLLVTDGKRDRERDLNITRLGQGVDAARVLSDEAMERTVAAIGHYVSRAVAHDVERLRIIATSAVRDAANRDAFLDAVEAATGQRPDVLSGDQEAQLGFSGATGDIDAASPYLVCDIGGGSTELVLGTGRAERFISMDIGSVRLTERHVSHDPPLPEELQASRDDADHALEEGLRVIGADVAIGTLVGLAGTITTIAAVDLRLDGYDRDAIHHHRLTATAIASIRERLVAMTSEQRRSLPAMPRGREDVITTGVVILEQVMEAFGLRECLVSESDILDGTAQALLRAPR